MIQAAYQEYQRCVLLTQNELRSTQVQNAEEEDVKTGIGSAAVIDGMMAVILRLTKTHQSALTAEEEEESRLQQAQQEAVALREKSKTAEKVPHQENNWTKRWRSIHMKQTQPEGSIKRKSIHPTCDEELMKAMRAGESTRRADVRSRSGGGAHAKNN